MNEIQKQLAELFDPREIKWKPQMVRNNRALAIAYIDARLVADRLDEVVGIGGWQDKYEVLQDGSVICTLSVLVDGSWITKQDVGSLSDQPDPGDRLKSAFSDALKRVAVKFGIGRYLYRLPSQWVDFDPNKKQITQQPTLPDWAIPGKQLGQPRSKEQFPHDSPQANGAVPGKVNTTSTEAVDKGIVASWANALAKQPNCDQLNGGLPNYYAIGNKHTQRAVFRLIDDYAKEHGFEWDNENKRFVPPVDVPQGDDEKIPF